VKPSGYLVMERCEDYEQVLTLRRSAEYPSDGILDWADRRDRDACTVFPNRASARAAITRTEHYRLAFGRTDMPEKKFCVVVPVEHV